MSLDPTRGRLLAELGEVRSRGEIKRLGEVVDRDPELRGALIGLLSERGVEVEEDATGKRLVRAALDREEEARRRTNPIRRDESFQCITCGLEVPPGGALVRDHCPRCLRGLHVDVVPGDRAAECGGILQPVRLELRQGVVLIHYQCERCQHTFLVRAHPDDRVPPSLSVTDLYDMTPR